MKRRGDLGENPILILRTIQKLQPCGATSVARATGISEKVTYNTIYQTLYRRGLIDNEIDRNRRTPRRKNGTLRVTVEGEYILSLIEGRLLTRKLEKEAKNGTDDQD